MRPIGYFEKLVQMARIGPAGVGAGVVGLSGGAIHSGASSGQLCREVPKGTKNGANTTFTLTYVPSPAESLLLLVNGVAQTPTTDFSLSDNVITYVQPPISTDWHLAYYFHGGIKKGRLARKFNDGVDRLDWGHDAVFNLHGDMAVGLWLKLPSDAQFTLIGYGGDSWLSQEREHPWQLLIQGASNAWDIRYHHNWYEGGIPCESVELDFDTNLANQTWYYIGVSRDATAKTVSLYKATCGGALALVSSQSYTDNPTADIGTDASCHLDVGYCPFSGVWWGPGKCTIEDHYIWDRVLTCAEHQKAMAGEPSTSGLLLACVMGDDPEQDTSSNGHSGTVTGTTTVPGR